ncbi:hypothetical protein WK15_05865 [Burkholderia ubonensis]|uniref:gp53-like domain-containing protein n=1 Tax=Burkholderia ubonensis TaxID=101571 RepID=UPI00075797F6|nr:hypothetical protein [Burkholderia ubonensis]KVN50005.1 hypothetical protein WJ64_20445 [Burkholderia ubonensis]KVR30712.1 hypothetical protein WK15_05865 [Burkholderia ubonensis]KWI27887.1 hypothetical protein WM04_22680 [Burkholderia ubonensis]OJB14054.1 hypothetical protein BGV53_24030 [Burkholderia ubonensis]
MTDLVESSTWTPGIRQFETSDPVEGGPDGIDNVPLRQLANRTRFLKDAHDALAGAENPYPQYATILQMQAAISALVDAAPGALDTLNELAKALGNDPNFATTMTNALALKAAIDSPVFTGTPKAPTPAQFDNSGKLATTAFVQQALGNFQGFVPLTASATLTASQTGSFIEARGTSGYSIALPSPSTPGLVFTIFNANSNSVTLSTSIGAIYSANNSSSSYIMTVAQSAQLVSDGSNWVVISGQAAGALLTNGYQKLPSGLILQWGSVVINASGVANVTFPIAFPNQQIGAVATINATLTSGLVSTSNFSKTGMSLGTQSYQTTSGTSAAVTYLVWGF